MHPLIAVKVVKSIKKLFDYFADLLSVKIRSISDQVVFQITQRGVLHYYVVVQLVLQQVMNRHNVRMADLTSNCKLVHQEIFVNLINESAFPQHFYCSLYFRILVFAE